MIEEILINYGVAGAMIIYFISDRFLFQKNMQRVVENNTQALASFTEATRKCTAHRNI
jgi:hypothetical protein